MARAVELPAQAGALWPAACDIGRWAAQRQRSGQEGSRMTGTFLDYGTALYAEGHRHGLQIARQRGLAQARKTLWALRHACRPRDSEAGEYVHGVIDALEQAIGEGQWQ